MSLPVESLATPARFVVAARRLVTCDERRPGALGVIEQGAALIESGRIVAVGERGEILASGAPLMIDAELVTPGLVDAHTHAAWAGSRHHEYTQKLAGEGYEAIAKAGGGIRSTMAAVRATSDDELTAIAAARLGRMLASGVTTVEVKSGYGLSPEHERRQLAVVARLSAGAAMMPRLVPTFLALHAIAPEYDGRRDEYVATMTAALDAIVEARLARFVDAYVDRAAFSVAEAEPLLRRAREHGLGVRLHAGQFADVGGAEMAARLGAASADHLEQISPAGIEALARAGVAAVLLPVACFTLGQTPPPVAALRAAGVPLVVASDANPGTAPTESLTLALAFAARLYGLTAAECLLGATRHAARSLGLGDEAGVLAPGRSADLVAWALPHEEALVQPWGRAPVEAVVARGSAYSGLEKCRVSTS